MGSTVAGSGNAGQNDILYAAPVWDAPEALTAPAEVSNSVIAFPFNSGSNPERGTVVDGAFPRQSVVEGVSTRFSEASSRVLARLFSLMGGGRERETIVTPEVVKPVASNPVATTIQLPAQAEAKVPVVAPVEVTFEPQAQATPTDTEAAVRSSGPAGSYLVPPEARDFKATGEMEWKPTNRYGLAQMTFRPEHKGRIASVQLLSEDGTRVIGTPTDAGVDTKGRPVWRFKKPGEQYPKGAILMMTMKDGGVRYMEIPNPANTFTY